MPASTRIEEIPELAAHARKLTTLGYTQLNQLEGLLRASPDALAKYLGASPEDLTQLVNSLSPTGPSAMPAGVTHAMPLGARLTGIAPPMTAMMRPPGLAASLPPTVNMIDQMQPIRDQGQRGTCVAHACTAVAEHYFRMLNGSTIDLSRQFLYCDCKRNDGDLNGPGTWISVAMKCLTTDGCCLEATWPYDPDIIPGDESQGPPPDGASAEAANYVVSSFRQLPPTSLPDIKGELAAGRCVAFSIPVFKSWYEKNPAVQGSGAITNPIPGETTTEGHAMCFVGYEDDPTDVANGGGHFIIRNSWDSYWATNSVVGVTGYGTIPYSYINAYCAEAYSLGG
ncbi:C1 family peptidase [Paraburkholderia strydomiana]|uniref:C1 family peptidase n=1 Tax=Paraburkholderia strydomiana TaxID=1245417 RepID=UPI0038B6D25C